jgi:hypothetical protein
MAPLPPNSNPAPVESMSQLHMACLSGEAAVAAVLMMYREWANGGEELFMNMINMKTIDDSYTAGYTPLHYACQTGHIGAVKLLLEGGADPNIAKNNGATPIVACVCRQGRLDRRDGTAQIVHYAALGPPALHFEAQRRWKN